MTDIERDLKELGRLVWPDPEQVRRPAVSAQAGRHMGGWLRFGSPLGVLLGTAIALALIGGVSAAGIVALEHHPAASSAETGSGGGTSRLVPPATAGSPQAPGRTVSPSSPNPSARIVPSPQVSSSPFPSPNPPPAGGTLTITQNSRGTYEVRIGTTINVDLNGGALVAPWSMPSSNPAQIVRFERGSRSAEGDVSATFIAAASGQASIQASRSPQCPPVCGLLSYFWHIEIIVIA
jgi:hypothetical protein